MINIFDELFTLFDNALTTYDEKIGTASEYTNSPSKYPFASLEEIDNRVYEQTSDSCDVEEHAEVEYEVNIYTQGSLKKSKCDDISDVIDNLFKDYNLVRTFKNPIPSGDEATYRIVMRYRGVVSKDHTIYRR